MKTYDMYGNITLEVTSLERRGAELIMKGKGMGALQMTMYLRPEEIWKATKLLSWSVVWYMPIILIKGWWLSRKRAD